MLRFRNLASGSSGNATVVEGRTGTQVRRLLVDCGLGIRQLQARLHLAGLALEQLDVDPREGDRVPSTKGAL